MSRIEKTDDTSLTVPAVEQNEVIQDLTKKRPRRRGSCLTIIAVFFVLVVVGLGWMIASTGLLRVPILSSIAFRTPVPTRHVSPGLPAEKFAASYFASTVAKRLQEGGGEFIDRTITLQVPESSLTATLQNALRGSSASFLDVNSAQIVVLPNEELELFIPVRTDAGLTALTARVSLVADQGKFNLSLKDVLVGSVDIPGYIVASSLQPFVNRELASLNQALSSYMHVDSLRTLNGALIATGSLTVQIKK